MTSSSDRSPAITAEQLAAELGDTVLHVAEHPFEFVITNPGHPEHGQVHIAKDDAYACWEHPAWHFWGPLEGHATAASRDDRPVGVSQIIEALTNSPAPLISPPPCHG